MKNIATLFVQGKRRDGDNKKHRVGRAGEDAAAAFLRTKGYKIVERNWCNARGRRVGEIDLVARDGQWWVFVEVKTSAVAVDRHRLPPQEQITAHKMQKMSAVAQAYVRAHGIEDAPWRFDAVAVYMEKGVVVRIEHLPHIFV